VRLFYSNPNFSGDGFGGYLRGFVGWVWMATFLIFLFLFLTLFMFISREMMFAVVGVTITVPLLLALAGNFIKVASRARRSRPERRNLIDGGDGRLRNAVVMLRGDGCRTVFLFGNYGDNEATVHSSFMLPEPVTEQSGALSRKATNR
jgi:hypothetical protein